MKNPYVTASEIGEFVYCKRAWWLRQRGGLSEVTKPMRLGMESHNRLSLQLKGYQGKLLLAGILISFGILGLLGFFIYMFFFS